MQQGKLFIEENVQDLDLTMKAKLYLITKEQFVLWKDAKVTTVGFANWFTAMKNSINRLKKSSAPSRFGEEISQRIL